ncbi:MAG: mechanosensitive ion channel family protein [Deinococcota bacterium]|jgi:small conductance mechanosensitive channel|nr:mechanosensitive ion channel family protein [Deinococcota bacterium]
MNVNWLENIRRVLQNDPTAFLLALASDAFLTLLVLALLGFFLTRWAQGARRALAGRDWDEARREGEQARLAVIYRYLHNTLFAGALLLFLGLFSMRFGVPLLSDMALGVRIWLVTGGAGRIIVIVLAVVAANALLSVARRATGVIAPVSGQRFERQVARAATIRSVVDSTLQVVVSTLLVIFVLSQLGADIAALLAGVGILGLAISFGAQSLVKDLITGFFILMEDQYGVGDVVTVAGLTGLVEAIGLRITTLRDVEGRVHIIPNGQIDKATVMSKDWSRAVMDIEVAYRTDLEQALAVLRDEAERFAEDPNWQWRILEPPEVLGVEMLGASGIALRCLFKTLPKEQWNTAREFRKRIKARFDAENIEIPFPHLTVYWGEGQRPELGGGSRAQE